MTVVDLYTIQIIAIDGPYNEDISRAVLDDMIAEVEENLADLLNDLGYAVRIRPWDTPYEETNPDE